MALRRPTVVAMAVAVLGWGLAASKHQGPFRLQMRDGNFYIDDGSGEVPLELTDKGPDLTDLQDVRSSQTQTQTRSHLPTGLRSPGERLPGVGGGAEKETPFSELDVWNRRQRLDGLRRLLDQSCQGDALRGDETEWSLPCKQTALDDHGADLSKAKGCEAVSKISDADLLKIREVMDREYGKSILLIPKHDLENLYHFVKEYPMEDLPLRGADDNVGDRVWALRVAPPKDDARTDPERSRQQAIVQELTQFLDEMNVRGNDALARASLQQTPPKTVDVPKSRMKSDGPASRPSAPHREPVSLEEVRDLLQTLSADVVRSKQSLRPRFDNGSDDETSWKGRLDPRRSLRPSPPDEDGNSLREPPRKPDKQSVRRIDRADNPAYRKRKRGRTHRAAHATQPKDPTASAHVSDRQDGRGRSCQRRVLNPPFLEEEKPWRAAVSGQPQSRADFIR